MPFSESSPSDGRDDAAHAKEAVRRRPRHARLEGERQSENTDRHRSRASAGASEVSGRSSTSIVSELSPLVELPPFERHVPVVAARLERPASKPCCDLRRAVPSWPPRSSAARPSLGPTSSSRSDRRIADHDLLSPASRMRRRPSTTWSMTALRGVADEIGAQSPRAAGAPAW